MRTTIPDADAFLRTKGIKASYQRVRIFDYLQNTTAHPSVSQIFSELHDQIPSLSRATVYNTINLFVEKKLVIPVQVDHSEARYDLSDPRHAHFHCVKCHQIFDISLQEFELPEQLKNFEVHESSHHFKGICPACKTTD